MAIKIKPNYFSTVPAKTTVVTRSNGRTYTKREDKMRFYFPDEWAVFYDMLKPKQKITFHFLINTGARINEVRNITVGDVDFERNSIIIRMTKSRNKDGTRKIRVIGVSTQFIKWLRALIKEHDLKPEDKFPILSTPGANLAMEAALEKIPEIKDRDNFSVHSVRKTTEVWLLSLDVDSLKVTKHIGHTIAVAQKYYVSPDTFNYEDKKMMREIIGDLYAYRPTI